MSGYEELTGKLLAFARSALNSNTTQFSDLWFAELRETLTDTATALEAAQRENAKLRELLKHADDVTMWEGGFARAGFQEEIEAALGIVDNE
jgi:hypothetical protein